MNYKIYKLNFRFLTSSRRHDERVTVRVALPERIPRVLSRMAEITKTSLAFWGVSGLASIFYRVPLRF